MCTKEELGLVDGDSTFLPIFKTSLATVETYANKFQCVDRENLTLYGDYNSDKAMLF